MVAFISRAGWGAALPLSPLTPWPAGQPSGYTVHWEGAGGNVDHSQCAGEVRMIQHYHQTHGYIDIAYNWVICVHGVIFEGRPAGQFESAAQRGGNPTHIAICFMWGPSFSLSNAARNAGVALVGEHLMPVVIGHRDEPSCQTSCPGDNVEAGFVHGVHFTPTPPSTTPAPAPAPLPLPPGGVHHPVLRQGNVGPAVAELQRKLNAGCGQRLTVDGVFGAHTHDSVVNVQRFFHLQVDGIAGPRTWSLVDYTAALHGVR